MKFRKKSDSSINDSTKSSPVNPELDSPTIQQDSKDLLSPNDELDSSELLTAKSKKKKRGFAVVVRLTIFLGVCTLGVLALPSSCGNKAKQSEAKTYVDSMNRAQQAFQLENKAFTNSFDELGLGIATQTANYQYSTRTTKTSAFNYAIPIDRTKSALKGYVGGVFLVPATTVDPKADKKEMTTVPILCEAVSYETTKLADPILQNGVPTCGSGTKELGRRYSDSL